MRRGWYGDSYRHSLSARGIATRRKRKAYYRNKFSKQEVRQSMTNINKVQIISEKHQPGKIYPMTKEDVKEVLKRQNPDDLKGLKAIRFEEPRNIHQKNAWAQMKRGKKEIAIFAQPEEEITPQVHMMMKNNVLPHEIGHHVALNRRNITDQDLAVAEARADAFAQGFDVEDEAVGRFIK